MLGGSAATLGTFLTTQAAAMVVLHGGAVDPASFANPKTIQLLRERGLVVTVVGRGTFVVSEPPRG